MAESTNDNSSPPPPPAAAAAAATSSSSRGGGGGTIFSEHHLALTFQTIDQLITIFSFPSHIARQAVETVGPEDVTQCYNWILDNYQLEDCGGPVVPKLDCPHLERCCRVNSHNDEDDIMDSILSQLLQSRQQRQQSDDECCTTGVTEDQICNNIFQLTCQQYSSPLMMRRPASRKRLRSEEDGSENDGEEQPQQIVPPTGQLKRDEDYSDTKNEKTAKQPTTTCCNGKENWLCLQCGLLLCSRYEHGHAKLHWEDTKSAEFEEKRGGGGGGREDESSTTTTTTGHCIAVSLADLSVWCYECNAYLHHDSLTGLMKCLEDLKFGSSSIDDDVGGDVDGENKYDLVMEGDKVEEGGGAFTLSNDNEKMTMMELEKATKPASVENGYDVKQPMSLSMSKKKKSQPKKLTVGKGETCLLSSPNRGGGDGFSGQLVAMEATKGGQDDGNSENSDSCSGDGSENGGDDENESSNSSVSSHQAAILATLLRGEQGEAIRAYLNRHESFNTSDMGQCVPMHMPAPPTFPNEMADFLRSPMCRSICVLAGAGMSVSSGIPDFRSAGVGLYDTIRPELLTATELEQAIIEDDPTLALDKGMFLRNPLPMLELKRDFILGTQTKKWKATLAHRFVELLHTKLGKLTRLYTQNIDGLELQTSIPKEKIVNVHGSMGAAACELCEAEVDFDEFCSKIASNIKDITGRDVNAPTTSTPISCEVCGKPTVKPTIVLFRGQMPQIFHRRVAEDLPECDLLIIIGTSLQVAPANSLVYRIPPTALRMVMNNEKVGRRLGIMYGEDSVRDVFAHGHSDETCLDLADQMGWLPDLAEIIDELPETSARLLRQRLEQREYE
ncbi:hypothetical protein ACHAXM_000613 [Skeletonema potamos]